MSGKNFVTSKQREELGRILSGLYRYNLRALGYNRRALERLAALAEEVLEPLLESAEEALQEVCGKCEEAAERVVAFFEEAKPEGAQEEEHCSCPAAHGDSEEDSQEEGEVVGETFFIRRDPRARF